MMTKRRTERHKKKKKEKNFKLWGWSEVLNFNPLP